MILSSDRVVKSAVMGGNWGQKSVHLVSAKFDPKIDSYGEGLRSKKVSEKVMVVVVVSGGQIR